MKGKCERCKVAEKIHGERFCKECRKAVLIELAGCGYLDRVPRGHVGQGRSVEARENILETKRGRD